MWTYEKMKGTSNVQGEASGCGKYYRHHKDCFLELGLVKAAFLWELLKLGYDVLISDLDVVWLTAQWEPWMTYRVPTKPPLPEVRVRVRAAARG